MNKHICTQCEMPQYDLWYINACIGIPKLWRIDALKQTANIMNNNTMNNDILNYNIKLCCATVVEQRLHRVGYAIQQAIEQHTVQYQKDFLM